MPIFATLVFETALSGVLLGVLWFVQLIHYPLFFKVKEDFLSYEKEHVRKMTYFIIPLIILDVFLNVVLTVKLAYHPYSLLIAGALAFNLMAWLSTLFFQLDQHRKLCASFSHKTLKSLINTSWIRTVFWTIKTVLIVIFMFYYC